MLQRADQRVLRDVGRRIAELRAAKGWTQERLAEQLDVGTKYVQAVEGGQENLTLVTLVRIARIVDATARELFRAPLRAAPGPGRPRRAAKLPFVEVEPSPEDLFRRAVPLVTLEARAGSGGAARLVETAAWVVPNTKRRLSAGMFVARIFGDSMEPEMAAGAWGLFQSSTGAPPSKTIVLVRHGDVDDEGATFHLKQFERGRGSEVRFVSRNPAYAPIKVERSDETWRVIAMMVEILRAEG